MITFRRIDLLIPAIIISTTTVAVSVDATTFEPSDAALTHRIVNDCQLNNKFRPVADTYDVIHISLSMVPFRFTGIDDRLQTFSIISQLNANWTHPCTKWDVNVDRVPLIQLRAADCWFPVFQHLNSQDDIMKLSEVSKNSELFFFPDGSVVLPIPTTFNSFCELSLKKFPFDSQTCDVFIENYYGVQVMVLEQDGDFEVDIDSFTSQSDVWEIVGYNRSRKTIVYPAAGSQWTHFDRITFSFHMRRLPQLYIINIFFPSFCLLVCLLSAGIMPPHHPDRALFTVTVLLAYTVSQGDVSDKIPDSSETPYIVVYMASHLGIAVLAVVYSLLANDLAKRKAFENRRVPICGRKMALIRFMDMIIFGSLTAVCVLFYVVIFSLLASN